MRWMGAAAVLAAAVLADASLRPDADDTPATLEAFRAAAALVVEQEGLPGAGIALVRSHGIEWAGGIGWADRDRKQAVTADTLFRVGSVSKTFVAMALVQLYEDGQLDLDAPVASLVPEVVIDNPWDSVEPLRVRHLLEHTAGFDDMHFNEVYVLDESPDLPLDQMLLRNPSSRRVRWRPGTRMAYSNPGYAVAGRVIEAVSGKPFDQFIRERIFAPLDMTASTFSGDVDDAALAQGYDRPSGPPVVRRRIHLRPAGALHSTARELGRFVEMLLNWGERGASYVVDPEYLSNMEWPRTTAAATAGVRAGYGLGIASTVALPFHVLGHQGGIDGFVSTYGYSPSRDVGYVVLLNGTYAPSALRRLSSLALRYLKREVEPPPMDTVALPSDALARFEGYYHDANPRHALQQVVEFPLAGRTVVREGSRLMLRPVFGEAQPLVAVNDALFRRESELVATVAFTEADGVPVIAGPGLYAEKRARWPIDLLRIGLAAALFAVALAPLAAVGEMFWRGRPKRRGAAWLAALWCVGAALLAGSAWVLASTPVVELAVPSWRSQSLFLMSSLYPLLAAALLPITAWSWVRGVRGWIAAAAVLVAGAHLGLAGYLAYWGLTAFRSWTY